MRFAVAFAFISICATAVAQSNRGYYRYPAIHGEEVVFTSEGDLWKVPVSGGPAVRLTTHPGEETMAAISPDGGTIAFSATYEGPTEIYTMPFQGGLPTRRTYDGARAAVIGWSPDGKLLYATDRYAHLPADTQLFKLGLDNRVEPIPLSQAAQGTYSGDGRTLFFTRLERQPSYTKRYQGGSAENIWKMTGNAEAVPLTSKYAGTSKNAMWWKGRVYFLSDRDGIMNLWSMNEDGKDLKQLTAHRGFDIQSASLSEGTIVYALAGDLRVLDTRNGSDRAVPVELPSDFDNLREHWIKSPVDYLTAAHISNDGERVILTARGRAFILPAKTGRIVEINENEPGRFREARLTADGKSVIVVSTESGETEIWKYPANGDGRGEELTKDAKVLRWEGVPSPDGKTIAHQDRNQQLWLYDVTTKTDRKIAEVNNDDVSDPAFGVLTWSPDSRWLALTENAANDFVQVYLYSLDSGKFTTVTSDRYNSGSPTWSPDGKWLYFISDRSFKSLVRSPWGVRQPDPFFDRMNKIYAVSLKTSVISPFEPNDELHPPAKEEPKPQAEANAKDANAKEKPPTPVKVEINLAGIETRLQEVPVPPGNYQSLVMNDKRLCWMDMDSSEPEKGNLQCVDINNKPDNKPQTLLEGIRQLEMSGDGKKLLVRKDKDFFILNSSVSDTAMKDAKTLTDAQVDLKAWNFSVIPADEFREEFLDAWRMHRDYFYDPNMHNVGWQTMRDKYSELIQRVRDRSELSEVIAQMVSELSALHTFVEGGDLRKGSDNVEVGSLGARLARNTAGDGFVVEHIYRTDPDQADKLSPLLRQGVEVREGDVIIEINGRSLATTVSPAELLRDAAGKQVLLTYKSNGKPEAQHVVVKAISIKEENDMRYSEWEFTRRTKVEQASGGRLAYIHLRAMGSADIAAWEEQYTPIYDREGLIIDVRHNFGGNIDSWVLDRLSRKAWMYWQSRRGTASWNMQESFRGPMVVLCDELTASDGEAFTEGFRRLGLGKVIGTRTWGGEIWLSFDNVLADNGIASAAETGVFGPEGKWLIEGHGVDPDVVLDNLPHASFEGADVQLDAAIDYLQKQIKLHPNPAPAHPPYPDKSFHPGREMSIETR